ncbi:MAG: DUF192 domain-containing protein [Firmicutes bacterium]|nr:DUF192 domain-containing protein [Bacillota bacterium]
MKIVKLDRLLIADSFAKRFFGYMFKKKPECREAILFRSCNSIHTFNMRFSIDVLFLDASNRVVKKMTDVPSGKVIPPVKGATQVVEGVSGLFKDVMESEIVTFDALLNTRKT